MGSAQSTGITVPIPIRLDVHNKNLCGADCRFLRGPISMLAPWCLLFGRELAPTNCAVRTGYIRCGECLQSTRGR